jgi:hypothetical protein
MAERDYFEEHAGQPVEAVTAALEARFRDWADPPVSGGELRILPDGLRDQAQIAERESAAHLAAKRAEHDARMRLVEVRSLRIARRSLERVVNRAEHTPARIRAYLAAHGWVLDTQYPDCSHWRLDGVARPGWEAPDSLVMVLDRVEFSDYADRVASLVVDLAGLHGVGELQVLADIEAADGG